jgi:hypothetical protein
MPAAHADRTADGGGTGAGIKVSTLPEAISDTTAGGGTSVAPAGMSGNASRGALQQETRSGTEEVDRSLQQDIETPSGEGSWNGRRENTKVAMPKQSE